MNDFISEHQVAKPLKDALVKEFGMNGADMVAYLSDLVQANPDVYGGGGADRIAEELTKLTPGMRQFFYPVVGGNEGIVDLFINGVSSDVLGKFDLFYDPDKGTAFLICCDLINGELGPDENSYGDKIEQLRQEKKIDLYELTSNRILIVPSEKTRGPSLLEVMSERGLSPHRFNDRYDFNGEFSDEYRIDPTDSGHYWEHEQTQALDRRLGD